MTHLTESDLLNTVLQLLTTQGTSSLAEGLRLLLDEAMRRGRSAVLQTQPYERCDARLGHANGFKLRGKRGQTLRRREAADDVYL